MENREPIVILGVSQSQLSIAKYYGGARVYGKEYRYIPERDALVRADWMSVIRHFAWDGAMEHVKKGVKPAIPKRQSRKAIKQEIENHTKSLFD